MYKIETHLHTPNSSRCGQMPVEQILEAYKKRGYDAICVTDHYNIDTWQYKNIDIYKEGDKLGAFLEGYNLMNEQAKAYDIKIILGAEIRFLENQNEYILFGFEPELLAEPKDIVNMGIVEFSKLVRAEGAFLLQAHPFRKGKQSNVPVAPLLLDGIEVINNNSKHESNNDQALLLAQTYHLAMTAGSDCHRMEDVGSAAILSQILPRNTFEMAQLLRSGAYELWDGVGKR